MPTIVFKPAARANYTVAHRPGSAIRLIVVHVTESSAIGAISWFRNPRAQASANYVVGQDGSITQMVRDSDIAWHAGNWAINRESIGIEHAGYTYVAGSFTDAEYRASAQLVAYEMRAHVLPIDRKHIIGHSEVPDPNHSGQYGGFAHHTDPGPHWNWPLYISYVAAYARGNTPPPHFEPAPVATPKPAKPPKITGQVGKAGKVQVSSSGLANGQTVTGYVQWSAKVSNADVSRVDFLIDGHLRWTEHRVPFSFGGDGGAWDTLLETNGVHVLTMRVVPKKGAATGQSLRVVVLNSPFAITAAGLTNGQTLSGPVRWEAVPSGGAVDHVDFFVDGRLQHTENQAPYVFNGDGATWNTALVANGPHTLTMRAVAVDGRTAESSLTIVVANAAPAAPPRPTPKPKPISIVQTGLAANVNGLVHWEAKVSGGAPDAVEFWIDGVRRWVETSAPYDFNGDGGRWDTTKEQPGAHVLLVRAVRSDGYIYDWQSYTVNVQSAVPLSSAPPAPTTMAVASSIADGSTVHGPLAWTATVTGATPDRVEFWIDGRLRHTETEAPYEFGTWDTTQEQNGAHTLRIRAVLHRTSVDATATVLVANTVPALTIAMQSLHDGATLSGSLNWVVTTAGPTPDRVEYWIDGQLRHTETSSPYEFQLNTASYADGTHQLVVKAIAGVQTATATLSVTIHNGVAPLAIVTQTVRDGATLSGSLNWIVTTSGPTPDRVEYWIDGQLRHTETSSPYEFQLNTTAYSDGAHQLLVKAISGSQTARATLTVTVHNAATTTTTTTTATTTTATTTTTTTSSTTTPTTATTTNPATTTTPAPPAVFAIASQTLTDGQHVSGTVNWGVDVTGAVRRVEFSIDGRQVYVDRSGPYGGSLDTRQLSNGSHTLSVRAVGRGDASATATITVVVQNP